MPQAIDPIAREADEDRCAETVAEAVLGLGASFKAAGLDTPELDARILVAEACGLSREALIANPQCRLTASESGRLSSFAARRLAREPVARIIGRRGFYGLDLEVGPATLDPRPDTETVVTAALQLASGAAGEVDGLRILDLGTGTGAILIALLSSMPLASGVGTDVDEAALAIAARNAQRHGVSGRARFCRSAWLDEVDSKFDIVVSNPPYIPSKEIESLDPEVALYDPRLALDGGADGLAAYRAIAEGVHKVLLPEGNLVLEVGAGQADAVLGICKARGLEPAQPSPHIWYDLAGRPRCVALRARR
ncbi:MAG: peptide chain release factor N(5)-glutamine methyltransferase [Bacteroidota bacterium]